MFLNYMLRNITFLLVIDRSWLIHVTFVTTYMLILLLQNKLEEVNNSVLPLSLTKDVNQGYSCFDLCW